VQIRPGADVEQFHAVLGRLVDELGNVPGGATTGVQLRDAYLKWVENAESHLSQYAADDSHLKLLHTDRYWRIRELTAESVRPAPLVLAEVGTQQLRLGAQLDQLAAGSAATVPASPSEVVAVLDTNGHLHFTSFDQIDWPTVVGRPDVLLAVPLVVLEELDHRKNKGGVLGTRADQVIKRLEQLLDPGGAPAAVRDHVRIALLRDVDGLARTGNNDDDILNRVQAHLDAGGRPVVIVSGDCNMRLRARGRQMIAVELPDEHRLPDTDEDARKVRALQEELARERGRRPQLSLTFRDGKKVLDAPPVEAPTVWDVNAVVARMAEKAPAMSEATGGYLDGMGGPTRASIRDYNARRETYLRDVRAWANDRIRREVQSAGGMVLQIVPVNEGDATAQDVVIVVRLSAPDVRFAAPEHLAAQKAPSPPIRPSGMSDVLRDVALAGRISREVVSLPEDREGWTLHPLRQQASIHVPKVRHGSSRFSLPPLWLIGDHNPVVGSVEIAWEISGVTPPVTFKGLLRIKPRGVDVARPESTVAAPEQGAKAIS
jgi:hypothetical protein